MIQVAQTQPGFFESVARALRHYADFDGRATRAEFWWYALFYTLVLSLCNVFSFAQLGPTATLGSVLAAIFAILTMSGFDPDPLSVPEPRFFFLIDKTNLSPSRVISLLALVIAFHPVFPLLRDRLGGAGMWLCGLGRNSLAVFAVGSLISLAAQILRFIVGGSLTIDTLTLLSGLLGMGWTAWFVEWRSRTPGSSSRLS